MTLKDLNTVNLSRMFEPNLTTYSNDSSDVSTRPPTTITAAPQISSANDLRNMLTWKYGGMSRVSPALCHDVPFYAEQRPMRDAARQEFSCVDFTPDSTDGTAMEESDQGILEWEEGLTFAG